MDPGNDRGERSQEVHYRFGRVEEVFAISGQESNNFLEDREENLRL